MNDLKDEKERAALDRLRANLPVLAAAAMAGTFAAFKVLGSTDFYAFLGGLAMFGLVVILFKLREWFGVNGYLTALFVGAVVLFLINLVL
ncbi:hypothetical protein [Jannaschia sp. CCS1]|uniref:hypothetical protein n=1 Tax=Jannaschia sp. (strain CCS1) TaxID=290400 RepID=UPI0005C56042|nr:hypothetical protein [Jannaschia sp. CCS1]